MESGAQPVPPETQPHLPYLLPDHPDSVPEYSRSVRVPYPQRRGSTEPLGHHSARRHSFHARHCRFDAA